MLASSKFVDAKDVVAKFIIESRTETTENNVLTFDTNQRQRNFNRQRDFQRNNFNNRNYYRNNNNFRSNYRGNYRSRNSYGSGYRNTNSNNNNSLNGNRLGNYNRQNDRGRSNRGNRVYYTENSEAPPPGAAHPIVMAEMQK